MKQIIVIARPNKSPRIKHVEFDSEKHTILSGSLVDKKTYRPLGVIQRVYSEEPTTV